MTKLKLILFVTFGMLTQSGECQIKSKEGRYFGEPIITDSLSTIFFPSRYNEEFLSTNKIAFWGDYYANIVVYDFTKDSYHKLFSQDTYIESFRAIDPYSHRLQVNTRPENLTDKWMFLLVKDNDYNRTGRIDERDPSILFVTTIKGENLKALTGKNENVVAFNIFDKQGFLLVKLQRDSNHDEAFTDKDKDFYFRKIDLGDLTVGAAIEVK
jgi:hypothetical protein